MAELVDGTVKGGRHPQQSVSGCHVPGVAPSARDLQADSVVVSDPAMIIMQPNSDGRVSIGLAPYCPYAKKKQVRIMRSGIVATMEVEGEMENEYRRIFGSGIVVANSSKIAL